MDDIKEKIGENKCYFLQKLENYIENKLIYFGSIKRCDYMPENSDIDIAIITDNINSTLKRLQNFLNLHDNKIRKIVQKIPKKDGVIYGYKTNYDDLDNGLSLEIVIYDKKYEKYIMEHIDVVNNIPIYILLPLIILKILYYKLHIISKENLKYFKAIILHKYLKQELGDNFIALKL